MIIRNWTHIKTSLQKIPKWWDFFSFRLQTSPCCESPGEPCWEHVPGFFCSGASSEIEDLRCVPGIENHGIFRNEGTLLGVADWSQRGSGKIVGWMAGYFSLKHLFSRSFSAGMVFDACLLNSTWAKEICKELSLTLEANVLTCKASQLNILSFLTQANFPYIYIAVTYLRPLTTNNYTIVYIEIYIYNTKEKQHLPIKPPSKNYEKHHSTHRLQTINFNCSTSCSTRVFRTTVSASSSAGPFDKRAQSSGEHLKAFGNWEEIGWSSHGCFQK